MATQSGRLPVVCGFCGHICVSRSGLTRHVQQTPFCRQKLAEKNRAAISLARDEGARAPGSDVEDDPPQDGDLIHMLYGTPQPESAFDVELAESPGPDSPPRQHSHSPPPRPPSPPPPPPNPRRVLVEEVPDDEDTCLVDEISGAAEVLFTQLESRVSSDFAALHAGSGGQYGPFPTQGDWEFAKWAKTEAVSSGTVDRLLNLAFMQAQLETKSTRDINRRVDALPSPAHFQHTEVGLRRMPEHKFDLYWRDPLELIADLLADPTFADHLILAPGKRYGDSEGKTRLYNELPSGDWMYETQLLLPDGATLLPIIISSDKTELTSFMGKHSCYPVYLTIGNIEKHIRRQPGMRAQRLLAYLPTGKVDRSAISDAKARKLRAHLFHHCMQIVCESLFAPAKDGVKLADSQGNVRRCHPILAAYVADYPEQCLVTCTRYGQACPRCDMLQAGFDLDESGELRNQDDTLRTIRTAAALSGSRKASLLDAAGLNDVPDPFWANWAHANIHCAITSDVLHQLIQGVGKHLVEWLTELAPSRELDARFRRLPLAQGLRHFADGITKLANVSGAEHKAIYAQLLGCVHGIVPDDAIRAATALLDFLYIAQYECHSDSTLEDMKSALSDFHRYKNVFIQHGVRVDLKLPKLHALQHYVESIRLFGTVDNYNTEATERLHIDLAKHAFTATNKRNFIFQMCRWLERREAVFWFATHLAWKQGRTFDARLRKPPRKTGPAPVVLTKRPHRPRVYVDALQSQHHIDNFRAIFEEYLVKHHRVPTFRGYASVLPGPIAGALALLPSVRVWNHVKFYTPDTQTTAAPDILNIAYASPVRKRFDAVLVNTAGGEVAGVGGLEDIRVGRLRAIFKVPQAHEHALFGDQVPGHLAYVEWYTPLPRQPNSVNGMFPLSRSDRGPGKPDAEIVEVVDIRRACQLFPKFGKDAVPRALTSHTIMDAYRHFYLNNRVDKDAYRSIYWDPDDSDADDV